MTLLNIHQRTLLERCHDLQKDGGIELDCSKLLKKGNNDKKYGRIITNIKKT